MKLRPNVATLEASAAESPSLRYAALPRMAQKRIQENVQISDETLKKLVRGRGVRKLKSVDVAPGCRQSDLRSENVSGFGFSVRV